MIDIFKKSNFISSIKDKYQKILIGVNVLSIEKLKNPSEKLQMETIKNNYHTFKLFKNPCDKAVDYMLKNHPREARVTNHSTDEGFYTEQEQKDMLYTNGTIQLIRNLNQKALKEVALNDSLLFKNNSTYFTKETQMEIIKEKPEYIQYVDSPSFELQKAAVLRNPNVYNTIKNKDERITHNINAYIESFNKRNEDKIFYSPEQDTLFNSKGTDFKVESFRELDVLNQITDDFDYDREEVFNDFKESEKIDRQILFKHFNDRSEILGVSKRNGALYELFSEDMKNDIEIAYEAVRDNSLSFNKVPEELKSLYGYNPKEFCEKAKTEVLNREIKYVNIHNVIEGINSNTINPVEALKYGSDLIRNSETVVKECIKKDPTSYEFASPKLKNEGTIFSKVLQQDGSLLRLLPENKRSNREVVMTAVNQNKDSFMYAHSNILKQYENVNDFINDVSTIKISTKSNSNNSFNLADRFKSLDNKHKETASLNVVKYGKDIKTENSTKKSNKQR